MRYHTTADFDGTPMSVPIEPDPDEMMEFYWEEAHLGVDVARFGEDRATEPAPTLAMQGGL
jgi:hypothetical protein